MAEVFDVSPEGRAEYLEWLARQIRSGCYLVSDITHQQFPWSDVHVTTVEWVLAEEPLPPRVTVIASPTPEELQEAYTRGLGDLDRPDLPLEGTGVRNGLAGQDLDRQP